MSCGEPAAGRFWHSPGRKGKREHDESHAVGAAGSHDAGVEDLVGQVVGELLRVATGDRDIARTDVEFAGAHRTFYWNRTNRPSRQAKPRRDRSPRLELPVMIGSGSVSTCGRTFTSPRQV